MNARTSRLLRRVAFAVDRVEQIAAQTTKTPTRSTMAGQEKALKRAWNRTPRHRRGEMRVRLVGIFQTLIEGAPHA